MTEDNKAATAHYPIGTVSTLTGVNPVTLRAWERRYGLVKPTRTDSGHRLYSADEVEKIKEVLRLVEQGIPIGQVRQALETGSGQTVTSVDDSWRVYLERMVDSIKQFDESRLEAVYNEAMSLYPVEIVTRRLLVPLLKELGKRWETAVGSVAEEHFFGVYMRNKLGARFHHRQGQPTGRKLLAACLPGELHEIGILLFALAAHDRNYRVVLLGADMPIQELTPVVRRAGCDAIVLSGSVEPNDSVLDQDLPGLVRASGVPVFVGGSTATRFEKEIASTGAVPVGNDLVLGLRDIDRALKGTNQ